jgi:hypothetical protein
MGDTVNVVERGGVLSYNLEHAVFVRNYPALLVPCTAPEFPTESLRNRLLRQAALEAAEGVRSGLGIWGIREIMPFYRYTEELGYRMVNANGTFLSANEETELRLERGIPDADEYFGNEPVIEQAPDTEPSDESGNELDTTAADADTASAETSFNEPEPDAEREAHGDADDRDVDQTIERLVEKGKRKGLRGIRKRVERWAQCLQYREEDLADMVISVDRARRILGRYTAAGTRLEKELSEAAALEVATLAGAELANRGGG